MYTKWLQEVTLATDIIIICSKSFLKKSVNPNTVPTTKTSDVVNICCTEKLWCDWCLGRRNLICPVPSVPSRFPLDSICFSLTLSCRMQQIFSVPLALWSISTLLSVFSPQSYVSLHFFPVAFSAFFSSQSHKANSHAVRFRACQLINKLLGSMAENAQIDDYHFDRIHQAMLVRVTDKFPNVRIQAALAMTRLQQPKDPDCPTINGLFFSLCLCLLFVLMWQKQVNAEILLFHKLFITFCDNTSVFLE